MTTTEHLRALLGAATPRPWRLDSDFGGCRGVVIGPLPADTDDSDWVTETVAFEIEWDEDAALIAHGISALPRLLAVAEAARYLAEVLDDAQLEWAKYAELDTSHEALCDALAALETGNGIR